MAPTLIIIKPWNSKSWAKKYVPTLLGNNAKEIRINLITKTLKPNLQSYCIELRSTLTRYNLTVLNWGTTPQKSLIHDQIFKMFLRNVHISVAILVDSCWHLFIFIIVLLTIVLYLSYFNIVYYYICIYLLHFGNTVMCYSHAVKDILIFFRERHLNTCLLEILFLYSQCRCLLPL